MNVYIPYTRLPSAYQEVEYIQSSGTQYIKIGTQFKTSYKIVIDFQMTVTGGDYVPLGIRTADGGDKRYGIDVWQGYFQVIAGGGSWSNTISEDTNRHTITINKTTAIVDGTSYSVQYADYTFNDGIGVFYYHRIGETPDCISSNKLYKLDIYDENGTHIYDLVPCYRKSDNVIGLYDLVNSVFYTNQGTGAFSKGNDVNMTELKNDYIGEVWTPGSNTVAYYKFDGDMNDSSGNNRNLSVAQGTFTYGTLSQGAKYIQTNFNSYSSQISSFPLNSNSATISFWMSFANGTAGNGNTSSTYGATVFDLVGSDVFRPVLSWGYDYGYLTYGFSYLDVTEHYVPSVSESWHLYTAVLNGGTASIYMDGVLRKTGTYTVQNGYSFRLNTVDGNSTQRRDYSSRDKLSELIFENKQWTAQEVQDYYNKTKSNYGL